MARTVTITTRARNLGYASSSTPTGRNTEIEQPAAPRVTGGIATIERALAYDHRIYSGGVFWRNELFVGGARVVREFPTTIRHILDELRENGSVTVTVDEACC
jgi:hypothetical protein